MMYDNIQYVKLGLLLGKFRPQLAEKLLVLDSLDKIRVEINKELGTNIEKGDGLNTVLNDVELALEK